MSLAFGHRFAWGRSALDRAVVPTLVLVTMENDSPVEVSGSLADFRMGACLRYGYALSKKWQFQAALDTEVSPGALMRDRVPAPGLDPLPVWTAGLRVGFAAQVF
jgi:hypothetical protein